MLRIPLMGDIRIGTSGWSYPSGPGHLERDLLSAGRRPGAGARFDELAYYAEHFDTVEVNSSFYRLPDPGDRRATWAARTPPGFDFSLKLYQKFTHPAMYKTGARAGPPRRRRRDGDSGGRRAADVDAFKAAIDPLAGAGKLGALLAQFPPSFRDSDDAREYLAWLLQAFQGLSRWPSNCATAAGATTCGDTLALLNALGAAWAQIDEPKFRFSIRQNHLPNLRALYYMRLHGRNAEQWWTHEHPDDRYNYLYSPGEIDGFADTVGDRQAAGPEDLRLHEQPLRREGGRQCRDAAAPAGAAGARRVPGRDAGALSVPGARDVGARRARAALFDEAEGDRAKVTGGKEEDRRGRRAAGRLVARW